MIDLTDLRQNPDKYRAAATAKRIAVDFDTLLAVNREVVERLTNEVSLPRYVGVVQLRSAFFDPIDFLLDTTSTERNINAVAVVAHSRTRPHTAEIARELGRQFRCSLVA